MKVETSCLACAVLYQRTQFTEILIIFLHFA